MRVAIVDKTENRVKYSNYIEEDFDVFHLVSTPIKKVLKRNIDLDMSILEEYDFVITIGAEATKFVAKKGSVTNYQGILVDGKYLPLSNPAMMTFKPEAKPAFDRALSNIRKILSGEVLVVDYSKLDIRGIEKASEAEEVLQEILVDPDIKVVAADTETTALYPRDGYVIGISLSWKKEQGIYISTDCITEKVEGLLREVFLTKKIIFHNAKFDIKMLEYHFDFKFPDWEDTMLMHYCLDETTGTHGLKQLAMQYTKLGDYDRELDEYKREYCRRKKIKLGDFTYDLIPFEIMWPYASLDTAATFELYHFFLNFLKKDSNIEGVYNFILKPGTDFLIDVEDNGVPFSIKKLRDAQILLSTEINELEQRMYATKPVKTFEELTGLPLNPGSTQQLRILLFKILGLKPIKKTDTGEFSTDAETLEALSSEHPLVADLLKIRRLKKIKSTYIDKIMFGIDKDGRLRTGFNLTTTTSGRLSSSGKLNLQQLPRDNKIVKACITARKGYKLVSLDLQTAEMYVAAVLSKDKQLQKVFTMGGDFHGAIAKQVFGLTCAVAEVKILFPDLRQGAKAISFGILYGSGPAKVAETANVSLERAKELIAAYFNKFKMLAKWLKVEQGKIKKNAHAYSVFGRKRRLKNVTSSDRSVVGHEVRSGINFLVQSVASDINLLAAIELNQHIKEAKIDAKIIMLVHDSIVAEVLETEVKNYVQKLVYYVQKDRGLGIPGTPIGVDIEVGDDYSFKEAA